MTGDQFEREDPLEPDGAAQEPRNPPDAYPTDHGPSPEALSGAQDVDTVWTPPDRPWARGDECRFPAMRNQKIETTEEL